MTVLTHWQVFPEERDNAIMQGTMSGSRSSGDMDGQRQEMDEWQS